jgi:hypothetical protein
MFTLIKYNYYTVSIKIVTGEGNYSRTKNPFEVSFEVSSSNLLEIRLKAKDKSCQQ